LKSSQQQQPNDVTAAIPTSSTSTTSPTNTGVAGGGKYGVRALRKASSRQLFDSADFALEGGQYLSKALPSVTTLSEVSQQDSNDGGARRVSPKNVVGVAAPPKLSPNAADALRKRIAVKSMITLNVN
jgi:hypothetical protein